MARALYKREWRKKAKNVKRYNKPLSEFLRLKHVNIYDEYNEFFERLDRQNPSARDLTKTETFRRWKKTLKEESITISEPPVTLNTYFIQESAQSSTATATIVRAEQEILYETHLDPLSQVVQDVVVSHNVDPIQINQADDIIDQIIEELEQEEAIQQMINVENQDENTDEGIGLNIEDEVGNLFDFDEADF